MSSAQLSAASVVTRNTGFMEAEVDEEIVALNIEKGTCYGLNPVAARIWRLLIEPIRIADICKILVSEYQVDPETCKREVLEILAQLHAEGMIRTPAENGTGGTVPATEP